MEIRGYFEGIEIREESRCVLEKFASNPSRLYEDGLKVYQLRGRDWNGYILAGIMQTHEDQCDALEPSALMANRHKL